MTNDELTKLSTFGLFDNIYALVAQREVLINRRQSEMQYSQVLDALAKAVGELSRRYMPATQPIVEALCSATTDEDIAANIEISYEGAFAKHAAVVAYKCPGAALWYCPILLWTELEKLWYAISNEYNLSVEQSLSLYLKKRFLARAFIDELDDDPRYTMIQFFYSVVSPEPMSNDAQRIRDAVAALHVKLYSYKRFIDDWTDGAISVTLLEKVEQERNYTSHYLTGLGLIG